MAPTNLFGFSTEPTSAADFLPYVKYDARSGTFTRVDRVLDTAGQWANNGVYIEWQRFRAIFDLENMESGILSFSGHSPAAVLVRVADLIEGRVTLPQAPIGNKDFKPGVRVMIKLANDIAGNAPIREISSNAKTFIRGLEMLYADYLTLKDRNIGMLPAVVVSGQPVPVKSGSGAKQSTNFQPSFHIIGWTQRNDLIWKPGSKNAPGTNANGQPPQGQAWPQGQQQPGYGQQTQAPPQQTMSGAPPWTQNQTPQPGQAAPSTGGSSAPPPQGAGAASQPQGTAQTSGFRPADFG